MILLISCVDFNKKRKNGDKAADRGISEFTKI
jgi:hypothetical protein